MAQCLTCSRMRALGSRRSIVHNTSDEPADKGVKLEATMPVSHWAFKRAVTTATPQGKRANAVDKSVAFAVSDPPGCTGNVVDSWMFM